MDDRLQRLRRQDDQTERTRLLAEQLRTGEVSERVLALAHYVGDAAAGATLGLEPSASIADLEGWLDGLWAWGGVAPVVALLEIARAAFEATRGRPDRSAQRIYAAFEAWIECPCQDHVPDFQLLRAAIGPRSTRARSGHLLCVLISLHTAAKLVHVADEERCRKALRTAAWSGARLVSEANLRSRLARLLQAWTWERANERLLEPLDWPTYAATTTSPPDPNSLRRDFAWNDLLFPAPPSAAGPSLLVNVRFERQPTSAALTELWTRAWRTSLVGPYLTPDLDEAERTLPFPVDYRLVSGGLRPSNRFGAVRLEGIGYVMFEAYLSTSTDDARTHLLLSVPGAVLRQVLRGVEHPLMNWGDVEGQVAAQPAARALHDGLVEALLELRERGGFSTATVSMQSWPGPARRDELPAGAIVVHPAFAMHAPRWDDHAVL